MGVSVIGIVTFLFIIINCSLSEKRIPPEGILKGITYAVDYMERIYSDDRGLGRGEDDPSYWGNGIAKEEYVTEPKKIGDAGYFFTKVTEYLAKEYNYNPTAFYKNGGLKLVEYAEYLPSYISSVCHDFYQKCYASKYRSIDGSCNNLRFPYYGQGNTILGRLVPPVYSDGIHAVRHSVDGSPLPPPRSLRYRVLPDKNIQNPIWNMLFVNFGQFVTHDMTHTPFYQCQDGQFMDCCYGYRGGEEQVHPKCLGISIARDHFYSQHTKEQCLNFARGIIAPNYGCTAGYASPINIQTSFLDLSLQYGRNLNESFDLRVGKEGYLKTNRIGDQVYLPIDKNAECFNSSEALCFKSGDFRTTIHPGLTQIQILSTRLHNVIARKLKLVNQDWDDEKLYQEARRINIAFTQHIIYNEYLPGLIGLKVMSEYGLTSSQGYGSEYDEKANPWIYAEFSGSAFRLHSSVYGKIHMAHEGYVGESFVPLEDYYNSAILFADPKNFLRLLRGYMITPQANQDKYYDVAISEYLLKDERKFGLDIGSFNIQRTRDYGVPPYNTMREYCGLPKANSFEEYYDHIDPEAVKEMKTIYKHHDDVDLYVGGIAERHNKGGILGPTHSCIIAHQFRKLKVGDRYFYTHQNQPHSFTSGQLGEIRKMGMVNFLCMTTELKYVPLHPFRTLTPDNPLISCSDENRITSINFNHWKSSPKYKNEL